MVHKGEDPVVATILTVRGKEEDEVPAAEAAATAAPAAAPAPAAKK